MTELSCPKADCARTFSPLVLSTYVRHVNVVHRGSSDAARKIPKVIHEGKATVPWSARTGKRGSSNPDAPGECGKCPEDASLLPAHPNCNCEPKGGWEQSLKSELKDVPENWTDQEWKAYIADLYSLKVKK